MAVRLSLAGFYPARSRITPPLQWPTLSPPHTTPVIPNKRNRINIFAFDPAAYRLRNVVERTFCRLKDFRAVATRYDKLARNFLAGVCIAAALAFWIR